MNLYSYRTDIGKVGIAADNGRITNLYLPSDSLPQDAKVRETAVIKEAAGQLEAYLAGELRQFSLPLSPGGTAFMQGIWRLLCLIPYGARATYREIALATGNTRAVRAVGMANHRNPLPIFIPCHRVVGSDGSLTGYRGGLALKRELLDLEQRTMRRHGRG